MDLSGSTTPGTLVGTVTGSGTTYNVAVSGMTGSGTVTANIPASVAIDGSTNPNDASTSTDNEVTYDITAPTVTINQAGAQVDPTSDSPINFTVVFSEPVTGFETGDVTLGGTAGATTAEVSGSGTTYNVAVSGMTGSGTVTASIASSVATDLVGNSNDASSSSDNEVSYLNIGGSLSLDGDSHSNTVGSSSSISITHTTGTGTNRLMLVGVSYNPGSSTPSITGVTFTYGATVLDFSEVITEAVNVTSPATGIRYAAIYSLLDPPAGQAGDIDITFSGTVSNGIVTGVTNFWELIKQLLSVPRLVIIHPVVEIQL